MSRHKNVRNLDIDDYMDDDDDDDYYDDHDHDDHYDDDYVEERQPRTQTLAPAFQAASRSPSAGRHAPHVSKQTHHAPAKQEPAKSNHEDIMLQSGVDYVVSMIGDEGFSYQTIADTLREFHYDGEKSVAWLLEHGHAPGASKPVASQPPPSKQTVRLEYTAPTSKTPISTSPQPPVSKGSDVSCPCLSLSNDSPQVSVLPLSLSSLSTTAPPHAPSNLSSVSPITPLTALSANPLGTPLMNLSQQPPLQQLPTLSSALSSTPTTLSPIQPMANTAIPSSIPQLSSLVAGRAHTNVRINSLSSLNAPSFDGTGLSSGLSSLSSIPPPASIPGLSSTTLGSLAQSPANISALNSISLSSPLSALAQPLQPQPQPLSAPAIVGGHATTTGNTGVAAAPSLASLLHHKPIDKKKEKPTSPKDIAQSVLEKPVSQKKDVQLSPLPQQHHSLPQTKSHMPNPSAFATCLLAGKRGKRIQQSLHDRIFRDGYRLELYPTSSSSFCRPSDELYIVPFAFDTPSPDDDVQSKQKVAFDKGRQHHKKPGHLKKDFESHAHEHDVHAEPLSQLGYDLEGMGFDAPAPTVRATTPTNKPRASPKVDRRKKVIDVKAEYAERMKNEKEKIRLVVVGHVDAGKSTLMGHLLYAVGRVDDRTMHKYERDSQKAGKGSFAFAWVLDETGEERERGITMDIAETHFETETKFVTLLDAPGHKDFIPNMITGAAQADVAILVVNATNNEFETGFEAGGQTREHALLIRSLGVTQLIVAVNKLDTVDWSQARFEEIKSKLEPFLKQQVGFKSKDVWYVPCSGLTGVNLVDNKEQKLMAWYHGDTLIKYIDRLTPPERAVDLPLRMSVTDVFKSVVGGASIACTIVCGHVQVGDRIMLMPGAEVGTVKNMDVNGVPTKWGVAGDHISIISSGIDMAHVNIGNLLCDPERPIRTAIRFRAQLVVFNIDVPITKGYPTIVHYQMVNEPAYVTRLISTLNKTTGEVTKAKPRVLTKNSTAVVEITMQRPICIEEYKEVKQLGRFMLRDKGTTIAAGIVVEIKEVGTTAAQVTQAEAS